MIPNDLREFVKKHTPRFNEDVANGLVYQHTKDHGEAWIESIWRIVASSFPPGLVYKGSERCSPLEEIGQLAKKRAAAIPQLDLAQSNFYMRRYSLEYEGTPLPPVYMRLPFFTRGNHIYISGSGYVASPVCADPAISVEPHRIFIRLLQIKLTVQREAVYYINNLPNGGETVNVAYSKIWNGAIATGSAETIQAKTTIAHYVFAKYGLTQAFKLYAGADVHYGTADTINEDKYPKSDWVICQAANNFTGAARRRFVKPCELLIAIPKAHYDNNPMAKYLIAGLFYVLSHFTYRQHYMDVDDVGMWRLFLGILIFGVTRHEGAIPPEIDEHISSMDKYIDPIVKANLRGLGYEINDIYQLFYLVLNNIDKWIIQRDQTGNSRYGKELSVLYYIYFDLTRQIFQFYFELSKMAKKTPTLTPAKITEALGLIRAGAAFDLKKVHGEVTVDDHVGGIMTFKSTAMLTPQCDTTRGSPRARTTLDDPKFNFDVSHAEVGHLLAPTKASPDGSTRLNPHVVLSQDCKIIPNPEFKELIDATRNILLGHYNQYF